MLAAAPSESPQVAPEPVGLVARKYQPLELAGRGGTSTVWRTLQHGPGRFCRIVALKHLRPTLAAHPLFRAMFHEEARIGAVLQDPNVAQIYDFLVEGDDLFLIIEWVDGLDLHTYLDYITKYEERETRWELMVGLAIGMLRGLAAAHERRGNDGSRQPIVHRDVTPYNLLISERGKAKLIDFGLSMALDRELETTAPGTTRGKAAYLSPEVVSGARATPRSDQFAAGAVLWEALAGRRLFGHADSRMVQLEIAACDIEPLSKHRPDVPSELVEIVHQALSQDPAERFSSAREMARRLGEVLAQIPAEVDLYAALAREVRDGRAALALGRRTQGEPFETPLPVPGPVSVALDARALAPVA